MQGRLDTRSPVDKVLITLTGAIVKWDHATMDIHRAGRHIGDTFAQLDDSSPIYRSDNLDMLRQLPPRERKAFAIPRHRLAKKARQGTLAPEEIIAAFRRFC